MADLLAIANVMIGQARLGLLFLRSTARTDSSVACSSITLPEFREAVRLPGSDARRADNLRIQGVP